MRRSPMLSRIDIEPNDNAKTIAIPDARWPCWGCCISRLTNDISEYQFLSYRGILKKSSFRSGDVDRDYGF